MCTRSLEPTRSASFKSSDWLHDPTSSATTSTPAAIAILRPCFAQKLSPTLAMYRAKNFRDACDKAEKLVIMGGIGHTSALYTNQDLCEDRVEEFAAVLGN